HFSGKHVHAQVIDDDAGRTLVAASTTEESLLAKNKAAANQAAAELIGKTIAERSLAKKLERVVFDRGGFLYHGKVKALAEAARESMEKVSLNENTIPHEVIGEFDGARVLLRPASPGTGVIAGGGVRAVAEAAGIRDVLAKSLGSSNHANVVKATIAALRSLR